MQKEALEKGNEILKTITTLQNISWIVHYPYVEFKCQDGRADLGDCDKVTRDKVSKAIKLCIGERIKELEKEFSEL